MTGRKTASLLRVHSGAVRVSNIALFFDLVYIFATHAALASPAW